MITFPIGPNGALVVIEPGNIKRLKEGRTLTLQTQNGAQILVSFTPDLAAFLNMLGIPEKVGMPPSGEKHVIAISLTPEKLDDALKQCQNLPEVER